MNQGQSKKKTAGQALIEYMLIFGFITFVSINMVKGFGKTMIQTVHYLAFELTEQTTVGVCKTDCFFSGFKNQAGGP